MALKDCIAPINGIGKTNICFDCQNACGGCSWTEIDPETDRTRFEPVPGWTAKKVLLNVGANRKGGKYVETYYITACPQFKKDPPRKTDQLELKNSEFLRFRGRMIR